MAKKLTPQIGDKFNLTIVDMEPATENFLYRGVSKDDRAKIIAAFGSQDDINRTISFSYDEGDVVTKSRLIHTLVFSEYISEQDEMEPEEDL